jgi:hypothetical protein
MSESVTRASTFDTSYDLSMAVIQCVSQATLRTEGREGKCDMPTSGACVYVSLRQGCQPHQLPLHLQLLLPARWERNHDFHCDGRSRRPGTWIPLPGVQI